MRKIPAGMMKLFFAAILTATASAPLAFGQFQNPIQAAKDAYNKAKQQQKQGQQPPAQGQPQSGAAPHPQKPGQAPAATQNYDTGPFTPPPGTQIEPTAMAPMQQGAAFIVSPHGVNVATASHNGSRPLIIYDGAVGPQFDQLFPEGGGGHPVIFSPDGNHWAYCGAVGTQWTVMFDGMPQATGTDAVNGSVSNNSCMLGFTSNSQHLYFTSTRSVTPSSGSPYPASRFVFDGKSSPLGASPDMRDYAFSPDGGNHVAYFLQEYNPSSGNPPPPKLVIDGQPAPYAAGSPQWTADSRHLYTARQVPTQPRGATNEYLLDGKPFMRAENARIFIPPVGNLVVTAVQKTSVNPATWFLAIGGKVVPGSEQTGGQIAGVLFSADGEHYAAHYINLNGRHFVFADGKKGREYPGLSAPVTSAKEPGFATFTPVTDKLVYRSYDTQNGMSYLVIDGQESDPIGSLFTDTIISPTGDRVMTEGGQQLTINGKSVQLPGVNPQSMQVSSLSFTPDGAHYAFVLRTTQGPVLYVDGALAQTAYAPANNQGQMNTPLNAPYVFSPDSKHIAYFCRSTNPAAGNDIYLCVDNKAVRIGLMGSNLAFSADSNHLFWSKPIGQGAVRIFSDGKPVVDGFPTAVSGFQTATWQAGPKNSLLVLLQGEQALQRVSITPAPDSSLAEMMGGPTELPAAH